MALHLITGYAGQEHITSADQGAYNIATYGGGNFVFDGRGRKFAQTVLSNNSVSIADGEAMMQGRYIKMAAGTSEEVTIKNGTTGNNRNDLICIRYEKSSVDATESANLVVIKGTPTTGTATDPEYNSGSITDGDDTIADFPLYRVKLNGINIETVQKMFTVKVSMATYMDNYQLPIASSSTLGGVKVGSGITKTGDGTISVYKTSSATNGSSDAITSGGVYNALTNGTVSKVGTNSVGSYKQPMYLYYGTPQAITESIGNSSTPIYMNNGVFTACNSMSNIFKFATYTAFEDSTNTIAYRDWYARTIVITKIIPSFSSQNKIISIYHGNGTAGPIVEVFTKYNASTPTIVVKESNALNTEPIDVIPVILTVCYI